jgi:hypothetical protein
VWIVLALAAAACSTRADDPGEASACQGAGDDGAFADYDGSTVLPARYLAVVSASSNRPAAALTLDGRPETAWVVSEDGPHELVLYLGGRYRVRGLRQLPPASDAASPFASYRVHVSEDGRCWGEPAASGSAGGRELVEMDRVGRYLKLTAEAGSGEQAVGVAAIDVLVASGFVSEPFAYATARTTYRYRAVVDVPGDRRRVRYEVARGPRGLGIDPESGELAWVAGDDQIGDHAVELRALVDESPVATQEFVVRVAVPRVVASAAMTAADGGLLVVEGTGTALDGLRVEIPPGSLPRDETVSLAYLDGPTRPLWGEMVPLGPQLLLLPELERPVGVRLDFSGDPPASVAKEDLYAASWVGPDRLTHANGSRGAFVVNRSEHTDEMMTSHLRLDFGSDPFAVVGTHFYRASSDRFALYWALSPEGEDPADRLAVRRAARRTLDLLEEANARLRARDCRLPGQQTMVYVSGRESAVTPGSLGSVYLVPDPPMFLSDALLLDPDRHEQAREVVAHELFHVVQQGLLSDTLERDLSNARDTIVWLAESTAVLVADEIYDNDSYMETFWGWDAQVTLAGLDDAAPGHRYRQVLLFKHLKATSGGFDACALFEDLDASIHTEFVMRQQLFREIDRHLQERGHGALADRYLTYVAAYRIFRDQRFLDDAEKLPCETADPPCALFRHSVRLDRHVPAMQLTGPVGGGEVMSVELEAPQRARVTMSAEYADHPSAPFVGAVYDDSFAELARLDPTEPQVLLDAPARFHVVIANNDFGLLTPEQIEIEVLVEIPSTALVGTVQSPDGSGVRAWVNVSQVGAPVSIARVLTEPDGSFAVPGLPVDRALRVEVYCDPSKKVVVEAEPADLVEFGVTDLGSIGLEESCTRECPAGLFSCDDTCIRQEWVCDGVAHCVDGADEASC